MKLFWWSDSGQSYDELRTTNMETVERINLFYKCVIPSYIYRWLCGFCVGHCDVCETMSLGKVKYLVWNALRLSTHIYILFKQLPLDFSRAVHKSVWLSIYWNLCQVRTSHNELSFSGKNILNRIHKDRLTNDLLNNELMAVRVYNKHKQ